MNVFTKLLKSEVHVAPILDYRCEVWGYGNSKYEKKLTKYKVKFAVHCFATI